MPAKQPAGPMMDLQDLRHRLGIIWPDPPGIIARWGGISDPGTVISVDPISGHPAIPIALAEKIIVAYESERDASIAKRTEYESYMKAKAEQARLARNAAAEKERERLAELSEKQRLAHAQALAERAAKRPEVKIPAEVRKAQAQVMAGDPLDFDAWKKKGSPAK